MRPSRESDADQLESRQTTDLAGLVALVTGCSRKDGIGRAVCQALAYSGAHVVASDVSSTGTPNASEPTDEDRRLGWYGLDSLVPELTRSGVSAVAAIGDVADEASAQTLIDAALDNFGRLDILVNNAAAPQRDDRGWSWEIPVSAFDEQMRVNARGTFLMSTLASRAMIAAGIGGRIINISSRAGVFGAPRRAAYSASKFAVIGLTQAMSAELAPKHITVNAVCPGPVDTARNWAQRPSNPHTIAGPALPPVGRMGLPGDVARVVTFLASPEADYITGQAISVNGGQHYPS
jgi:NAD(P)-dependent dehydrogenase (short-subunit alcohol dehydrogenase family)